MPRGSPFTQLCAAASRAGRPVAADLHAHTTASDGDLTLSQILAAARAARLDAVAVTDHDTLAAFDAPPPSVPAVELVRGVELSVDYGGREIHVLGLFVDPSNTPLRAALERVLAGRRERFLDYVARIPELAAARDVGLADAVLAATASPGRRHVAKLLVQCGAATHRAEAFGKFLRPVRDQVVRKRLLPFDEALALVAGAGGVAALAHPGPAWDEDALTALRDRGMPGLEVRFPAATFGRTEELIALAERLGFAAVGGSDCHGLDAPGRTVGACGLRRAEYGRLRGRLCGA